MTHRGLPRRLTDFIAVNGKEFKVFDFPEDFIERLKRNGKRSMSLSEIVEEYQKYQREKEVVANG